MANLTLALGAEADVASGAEVEALKTHIDGLLSPPKARFARVPRGLINRILAGGSGVDVCDLGSPSVGRYWDVRLITAVGADDHTALSTVTVASYVGDPATPDLAGLVDPAQSAASLPISSTWSRESLIVQSSERLFLVFYGASTGQALTGVARVWDEHDDLYGRT